MEFTHQRCQASIQHITRTNLTPIQIFIIKASLRAVLLLDPLFLEHLTGHLMEQLIVDRKNFVSS